MSLLLLTGMSGSGKKTAFNNLEDLGFNCVDNLPIPLLRNFVDLVAKAPEEQKVVVGIDIRSGSSISDLKDILDELDQDGKKCEILFLDAEDEVLVKRYKETRRNHPLLSGGDRVQQGIAEERKQMQFLKDRADYVIDTSHLLTRELQAELRKIFIDRTEFKNINVLILSFGYKYGIPADGDLVFDVRFLPNPYYNRDLRPLTGNDEPIREFVMKYKEANLFMDKLEDLIEFLIPNYIDEGKNQLVICIGCTGGKHRSVTLANELYQRLSKNADTYGLKIEHRDIEKDAKRGK